MKLQTLMLFTVLGWGAGCTSSAPLEPQDYQEIVAAAVTHTAWVQVMNLQPHPQPTSLISQGQETQRKVEQTLTQPLIDTAKSEAPIHSLTKCLCPDCGCDACACVNGICRCPHCLPEYATSYRRAQAERRGLFICCGDCLPAECHKLAQARDLIACRSWPGCTHAPGYYIYEWSQDGRLLLAESNPTNSHIQQVPGGRILCGPEGCRWLPDRQATEFSGGCTSGACGQSTKNFRRW